MDQHLLDILCCPTTRAPLRLLDNDELAALNRAIASGGVSDASGSPVAAGFAAGLITQDHRTIYRVDDDIPVLLADTAIASAQIDAFPGI